MADIVRHQRITNCYALNPVRLWIRSDLQYPVLWKNPQNHQMKYTLSKLTLAGIAGMCLVAGSSAAQTAAAPTTTVPENQLSGKELMQDAARRTAGQSTVSARIRLRANLLGQPLIGSGTYAQLRSSRGLLLRLELAVQMGDQQTSVKQVCDDRHLWIHRRWGEVDSLSRVDLRRVEQAAQATPEPLRADVMSSLLATGGLPKLLSQLLANFDFDAAPPRARMVGDTAVWTVVGTWQPDALRQLLPDSQKWVPKGESGLHQLPPHVPHRVVVTCGQDNLFPYRVEFNRVNEERRSAGQPGDHTIMTVELLEVELGKELDPRQFNYNPGNAKVADQTDLFIQSLGLAK